MGFGWMAGSSRPHAPSRGTLVVFNGNAGNRASGRLARAFRAQGLAVLLFDYRGYGGNPGTPTEAGLFRCRRRTGVRDLTT